VERHECGWYVPPSSPDALAQRLDALLDRPDDLHEAGRRGATIAREQFDRVQLAGRLEAILARVASK
jgi:glycosyltransferase involved in cell wall biosynthesis